MSMDLVLSGSAFLKRTVGIFFLPALIWCNLLYAGNATIPGEVSTPYPTVTNLAVEWLIQGDDDLDGTVTVEYRIAGEQPMAAGDAPAAVPRRRQPGHPPDIPLGEQALRQHFRPAAGTEYEIRLQLATPMAAKLNGWSPPGPARSPGPRRMPGSVAASPNTLRDSAMVAEPGDILLLTPGYYHDFTLLRDGTPERPIVLRSDRPSPS